MFSRAPPSTAAKRKVIDLTGASDDELPDSTASKAGVLPTLECIEAMKLGAESTLRGRNVAESIPEAKGVCIAKAQSRAPIYSRGRNPDIPLSRRTRTGRGLGRAHNRLPTGSIEVKQVPKHSLHGTEAVVVLYITSYHTIPYHTIHPSSSSARQYQTYLQSCDAAQQIYTHR
jgi:hypothetical protein